jgi:hypothetical protein
MTFFYDLNKRLADLAKKQNLTEGAKPDFLDLDKDGNRSEPMKKAAKEVDEASYSAKAARAGKDIGKPGKMFSKIAKSAGKEYGSKAAGERVAGAVLNKLRGKTNEADMEEGNEFSGELVKARAAGAKEFKVDGKTYQVTSEKKEPRSKGTAFDKEYMDKIQKEKEAETHSRYDVKDTGYSKRYTRKAEPDVEKDDAEVSDAPKKKGRPKGPEKGPERTTKGAWKHKGERKKKTDEDLDTDGVMMTKPSNMSSEDRDPMVDRGEYDREGDMAKEQLHTIDSAAEELMSILSDEQDLPEWVQKKITLAMDYIDTARDYMLNQDNKEIAEKAVSKAQRKAAGIAHAAKKGDIPKSELRGASKEMAKMPAGELKKFAKTKETGLPEKVKEADTEASKEKKSSGGFQFGKGVYESLDKKYRQALSEGMNVSVNMSTGADGNPTKNITVSAEGEDAEALARLLQMAGIGGHDESCSSCGKSPCGCNEQVDENNPDWPTNTETSDDALQYSGGLNKPKSTGQTTVPVIASQLRRQVSMEEGVELERSLFKLYQAYKAK